MASGAKNAIRPTDQASAPQTEFPAGVPSHSERSASTITVKGLTVANASSQLGIEANLLRRHWRLERRRLAALARSGVEPDATDQTSRAEERLDANERIRRVLHAVAELGVDDRELLGLVAWERMPHDDVAEVLAIPVGTVRSRLHRIRRRLEVAVSTHQHDSDDPKEERR